MAYGELNGHVTDGIKWTLKGRGPISWKQLEMLLATIANISRLSAVRQYSRLSYQQLGFLFAFATTIHKK